MNMHSFIQNYNYIMSKIEQSILQEDRCVRKKMEINILMKQLHRSLGIQVECPEMTFFFSADLSVEV